MKAVKIASGLIVVAFTIALYACLTIVVILYILLMSGIDKVLGRDVIR